MQKEKGMERGTHALSLNQLVTLADLENVRDELLAEIRNTRATGSNHTGKKWLKSSEVRKLLNISPGKLLALRASRQLALAD